MKQEEIYVRSSLDNTEQPSLYFDCGEKNRPLIVGLHTWSYSRDNQVDHLVPFAKELGFNLLLPEFRGPNLTTNPHRTKACASIYAKTDIKEAIDYIKATRSIDESNIFLIGGSGGGHMALMMAGFIPEYFRAIASFVPICDLKMWHKQSDEYREHIAACTDSDEKEMLLRSPVNYLDTIAKANVKVFHGKWDRSVPVSQSIDFFNQMMQKHPGSRCFLDIFDGGHEFHDELCKIWLLSQYQNNETTQVTG